MPPLPHGERIEVRGTIAKENLCNLSKLFSRMLTRSATQSRSAEHTCRYTSSSN